MIGMKEKLKQFFTNRYGGDPLNTVICVIALVSFVAASILGCIHNLPCFIIGVVLYVVSAAALIFSCFRMLSRDLTARKAEYDKYRKKVVEPLMRTRSELKTRSKQRKTHKFFKCPKCRQTVRVPKGKGKVRITCPKCGEVFIKET